MELLDKYNNYSLIYTDASKVGDNVDSSVMTESEELLYRLPEACSVFTGKATAVKEAKQINKYKILIILWQLMKLQEIKEKKWPKYLKL